MPYQYSIKNKLADFELRIYVQSLSDMKKTFEKEGAEDLGVNNMFESMFLSSLENISQSKPQYLVYAAETVVPLYNGNIGLMSHFDYPANSEYGEGYKYGTLVVIHKDDAADIYLSFLYNSYNREVFKVAEKALRFK